VEQKMYKTIFSKNLIAKFHISLLTTVCQWRALDKAWFISFLSASSSGFTDFKQSSMEFYAAGVSFAWEHSITKLSM
jgi:hypothetical protein